jgi:hypothetical protein
MKRVEPETTESETHMLSLLKPLVSSIRNAIFTSHSSVPGQTFPEPIFIEEMPEPLSLNGLSQEEIIASLKDGLTLSAEVGIEVDEIRWKDGKFVYEVWDADGENLIWDFPYDSLEDLLHFEDTDLSVYVLIG